MFKDGMWADYSVSPVASNPERTRGYTRVPVDIANRRVLVDIGYGMNMSITKGNSKLTNFRSPSEMGLQVELPSFYWMNAYNSLQGLEWGQWFTDRHRQGEHEVISGVTV